MPKYLIEVPHEADQAACKRAVRTFLQTGSHFLVNADWGCPDGEHKAWMLLEFGSREEARSIVPPSYRSQAKVVRLKKYKWTDPNESRGEHPD